MNILVTGNRGYVGSVLTEMLLAKGYQVTGFDTDYYSGCDFNNFNFSIKQISKDIRIVDDNDLVGIDAVIHLAALSNDPLSLFVPKLTSDINFLSSLKLAELSKRNGIKRFILSSSCSMYGIAGEEAVSEDSKLAPATAYAVSKVKAEEEISKLADESFSPTFLRFSTAYGISPRLRCDLVVNNLTGWAYTTGKIRIMSDGSPWRPAIHVEDFSRAFLACLEAPTELIHNEAFNVGQNSENYRIRDIADIVKEIIPRCEIEYTNEHGLDTRTYRVNFDKISTVLKEFFKPKWTVRKGVEQLYEAFKAHGLTKEEFLGNKYTRLNQLKKLLEDKKINSDLFWIK
jgi:nucleoside-diphosphate-sugar epimerase